MCLAVVLIAGSILLYPFLKVSVARPSVLAPEMSDEKAVAVLENLLKNIYRSFDFREEEDVYDRLATSVSGDLLSDIYLQNRKSLVQVKGSKLFNTFFFFLNGLPSSLQAQSNM